MANTLAPVLPLPVQPAPDPAAFWSRWGLTPEQIRQLAEVRAEIRALEAARR